MLICGRLAIGLFDLALPARAITNRPQDAIPPHAEKYFTLRSTRCIVLSMRVVLFAVISVLLGLGCVFFTYYTVRLAYVNLTAANISEHRQAGMYIGAVAFPVAALALGYLALWCARAAVRAVRASGEPR